MRPAVIILVVLIVAVCMTATAGLVAFTVGNYIEAKREEGRKEEFDKLIKVAEAGVERIPDLRLRRKEVQSNSSQGQNHETFVKFPFGHVRTSGR